MEKGNERTMFVSFLLDETGSMQSIKDDTIGGFNAYVDELKKTDGEILFSLVSFNSNVTKRRYVAAPIRDVELLSNHNYSPQAMTPLIDASVKIINATAEAVAKRDDEVDVVVVIQTDGLENVSVEYKNADLALLVKEKQAAGWQFMFLGAGLDAFKAAEDAGVHLAAARVLSYDRASSKEAFSVMARKMVSFKASGLAEDLDFDENDRDEARDEYFARKSGKQTKKDSPQSRRTSTVDDIEL